MKISRKPDYVLFISILILIVLGFLILSAVSITISQKNFGVPFHYLLHQIFYGFIPGAILGFFAYKINLNFLKKACLPLLFIIFIFMILVLIPKIGALLGGAKRWVSLGPITFQPSEFLKLIFIVYFAAWMAKHKQKKDKSLRPFLSLIAMLSIVSILLIAQPDISTLAIIALITLAMYFSAGTPIYQSAILILTGLGALFVLIKAAPYRISRFLVFLKPNIQPLGIGYQLKQSIIAIGSGGIIGQGLGLSIQKSGFLPQPMSDTIFAVFAEETGFVGSIIFIILVLIFSWQGFKIAKNSSDFFLKLMAIGITSWFTFQAFINIAAMIGVIPLTGIPLPFVSYGSSHLLAELIGVGLLLNISKHAKT